jgi:hypothetical protein
MKSNDGHGCFPKTTRTWLYLCVNTYSRVYCVRLSTGPQSEIAVVLADNLAAGARHISSLCHREGRWDYRVLAIERFLYNEMGCGHVELEVSRARQIHHGRCGSGRYPWSDSCCGFCWTVRSNFVSSTLTCSYIPSFLRFVVKLG